MKSICKIFSGMSVTFRDESNDSSSVLISYSDASDRAQLFTNRTVKCLIS